MEVEYHATKALIEWRPSIGLRWIQSQKLHGKIGIRMTVRHNVNEHIGTDEHQRYFRASAA